MEQQLPMKRRRILVLLALAAVAMGVFLFWPRGPKEPVYQGKRLTQWIGEATAEPALIQNEQDFFNSKEAARKAIRALGTNALPWLMAEYSQTDPKWRKTLDRWVSRITGKGQLTADEIRHNNAFEGLRLLGPDLAQALPELAKVLSSPDDMRASTAGYLMAQAGEQAIPFLVEGIASTNLITGGYAANGLGWLAVGTEAAVQPLVQALQSTNRAVRGIAAWRLGHVPFRPELTIPALGAALGDAETNVSNNASASLAIMRKESAPLVAELHRLMAGTNAAVALTASNALYQLQMTNSPPCGP